jgi:hypothetical protein
VIRCATCGQPLYHAPVGGRDVWWHMYNGYIGQATLNQYLTAAGLRCFGKGRP